MAARQIVTMTMAIVLQKLNIAQIALGAKKVVNANVYDERKKKSSGSRYIVEDKVGSKPRVTESNAVSRLNNGHWI